MTYDCAPEIVRLIGKHEFYASKIRMKNGHHRYLSELLITRERVFPETLNG